MCVLKMFKVERENLFTRKKQKQKTKTKTKNKTKQATK